MVSYALASDVGTGVVLVGYVGPETHQVAWRDLYFGLLDYQDDRWSDQVIVPWADRNSAAIRELHDIGRPESRAARIRQDSGHYSPLEGLYAMSRVLDVLIAPYQPVSDDPAVLNWTTGKPWWTGRLADRQALPALAAAIGAVRIAEERFSPFFHEIVAVDSAGDPDSPSELVSEVWPGYLAGALLLVRAGVVLRAGVNVVDRVVASRSRMYWAWWRRNRQPTDLSHGWGSNSQWRTDFRRDYLADGELHYNVDWYKHKRADDIAADVATELVRHRCDILLDHDDQWPYGHTFTEPYR